MESRYAERARKLRNDPGTHYNCAQAALLPFAEGMGLDEKTVMGLAAHFGGGMKMGSVCGAVTGALMALGLKGLEGPEVANALCAWFRERNGSLNCRELLDANRQAGGEKKPFCDGLVYECVRYVEDRIAAQAEK